MHTHTNRNLVIKRKPKIHFETQKVKLSFVSVSSFKQHTLYDKHAQTHITESHISELPRLVYKGQRVALEGNQH